MAALDVACGSGLRNTAIADYNDRSGFPRGAGRYENSPAAASDEGARTEPIAGELVISRLLRRVGLGGSSLRRSIGHAMQLIGRRAGG